MQRASSSPKLVALFLLLLFLLIAALPVAADSGECATIKSGEIVYPPNHYLAGQPITNGYDAYGFNYQAQRFSGWFLNADLGFMGLPPYEGDCEAYVAANPQAAAMLGPCDDPAALWVLQGLELEIKWNGAYRSRTDCDGDGWFDRHAGYEGYIGSGAWYTNHVTGAFMGQEWHSFSKVVAVPEDAVLVDGFWYTAAGQEIGYAVSDATPGMAGVMDVVAGEGPIYKGMPGLGRW